jgi:excisionase family DNA binding protein
MHKTVLTTGDVAKICNVAPRTVSKWFDAGHLRGYRIPGSKDRRIPIGHLLRFMRAYGIPLNGLEAGKTRVLVFDPDAALCEAIRSVLTDESGCEVATATSALEAGAAAQELKPTVVIADVNQSNMPANVIVRFIRSQESAHVDCLIGTGNNLTEAQGQALLQEGFDGFLSKPFDIKTLRNLIEQATSRTTPAPSDR